MEKKAMGKRTAFIVLAAIIGMAILLGLLLLNKGDGPVTGMVLSDQALATAQGYDESAKTRGKGIYLVVSNAFNRYKEDYRAAVPVASDLYATVRIVECKKGSQFTGQWMKDGVLISKQVGTLATEQQGVIAYRLAGEDAGAGSYTFELYNGDNKIFEITFRIG